MVLERYKMYLKPKFKLEYGLGKKFDIKNAPKSLSIYNYK